MDVRWMGLFDRVPYEPLASLRVKKQDKIPIWRKE